MNEENRILETDQTDDRHPRNEDETLRTECGLTRAELREIVAEMIG